MGLSKTSWRSVENWRSNGQRSFNDAPFEEIKAELLADSEVKREYDALAPEFEASSESLWSSKRANPSMAEPVERTRTKASVSGKA